MVTYATNELIPSSEFAKKFGTYLSLVKNSTVAKLAILKNNKVEAVLISKEEYEAMQEALKKIEAQELLEGVRKGLEDVKQGRVQPIERLWDALDD
ncbi:MAG: type II toxin-antitoxin system Phd/YefM family antitoxin [Sulfurimonadaceae bacterium]